MNKNFLLIVIFTLSFLRAESSIKVGTGVCDLTPPPGTPSAGYAKRLGKAMSGVHDPLLATAILIQSSGKKIAFLGVAHLGFDHGMVKEVKSAFAKNENLKHYEVFLSSSHSHSAGGAFMDIPLIGYMLAGKFDAAIRSFYIEQTVHAAEKASKNMLEAKIGFAHAVVSDITYYRSSWPENFSPPNHLQIMKITSLDNEALAVLFNYALHPTCLGASNDLFSADFIAVTREELKKNLSENLTPLYINGAQAELVPLKELSLDDWENCNQTGKSLATSIKSLWDKTDSSPDLEISTQSLPYTFEIKANPLGLKIPIDDYQTELNLIVFNQEHAILTLPGELSSFYEQQLATFAQNLSYKSLSIFGLTNDAQGYIISPEAWEKRTKESELSFGGKLYGEKLLGMMKQLLRNFKQPKKKVLN